MQNLACVIIAPLYSYPAPQLRVIRRPWLNEVKFDGGWLTLLLPLDVSEITNV